MKGRKARKAERERPVMPDLQPPKPQGMGVEDPGGHKFARAMFGGPIALEFETTDGLRHFFPNMVIDRIDSDNGDVTFSAHAEPVPDRGHWTEMASSPHFPTPREELSGWWRAKCEDEIDMVVDKAIEYGARDLVEIGREMAFMAGRTDYTDAQHAELGCVFYMVGKQARITAAWHEGRMPSDDSYLDLGIYTRMVQRIREAGGWPGVGLSESPD